MLGVIVFSWIDCANPQVQRSAADYYDEGHQYLVDGQPELALTALSKAIAADSTLYETFFDRGRAYAALGRYRAAALDYNRFLRSHDTSAITFYYLGVAHYDLGEFNEALTAYQSAIRTDSSFLMAGLSSADIYLRLGKYTETIDVANWVLQRDSLQSDAYALRGSAYYALKNLKKSTEDFKEALRLNPNHVSLHAKLGDAFRKRGLTREALVHYKQYLAVAPRSPKRDLIQTVANTLAAAE